MLAAIKRGDLSVTFHPALFSRAPSADPPTYWRDGYEESAQGYPREMNPRANAITVMLRREQPAPEQSPSPEVGPDAYA
jgi:hypothetical protein